MYQTHWSRHKRISKNPIEDFLEFCAKKQKSSVVEVAKQALKNSDRFAEAYKKWADMKEDELVSSLKKPDVVEA